MRLLVLSEKLAKDGSLRSANVKGVGRAGRGPQSAEEADESQGGVVWKPKVE